MAEVRTLAQRLGDAAHALEAAEASLTAATSAATNARVNRDEAKRQYQEALEAFERRGVICEAGS